MDGWMGRWMDGWGGREVDGTMSRWMGEFVWTLDVTAIAAVACE